MTADTGHNAAELDGTERKVLDTIMLMAKEREDSNRFPTHIRYHDLRQRLGIDPDALKSSLNSLYKLKLITVGDTINDRYIRVNPERLNG